MPVPAPEAPPPAATPPETQPPRGDPSATPPVATGSPPSPGTPPTPGGGQPPEPPTDGELYAGRYSTAEALEQGHIQLRGVYGRQTTRIRDLEEQNVALQRENALLVQGDGRGDVADGGVRYDDEPPAPPTARSLEEQMAIDPAGYTRDVVRTAVQEAVAEIKPLIGQGVQTGIAQETQADAQRQQFFGTYPDLANAEFIVQAVAQRMSDEMDTSQIPAEQLEEMLVSRTRGIIQQAAPSDASGMPSPPPVTPPTAPREMPAAPVIAETQEQKISREAQEEYDRRVGRLQRATSGVDSWLFPRPSQPQQ